MEKVTDMNFKRLMSAATGLALGAGVAFTFALGDPGPAPTKAATVQTLAAPAEVGWYRPTRIYPVDAARPAVPVPRPATQIVPPARPAVSTRVVAVATNVAPTRKPVAPKAVLAVTTTTVTVRPVAELAYVYVVNPVEDRCFEAQLYEALANHWKIVHPSDCYNGFYSPGGWNATHTGPADPCQGKPCPQPVGYPRP